MSRRAVESIGGWFDPVYRAGWADADLGLRCWRGGGGCSLDTDPSIRFFSEEAAPDDSRFASGNIQNDFDQFLLRHHDLFQHQRSRGAFWAIFKQKFQRRFRSINFDYPIAYYDYVAKHPGLTPQAYLRRFYKQGIQVSKV